MRSSAQGRGEDGFALASTIGILGVVTLLVAALISATLSVTGQTRREVGFSAALGAAEAGVQDFLFRINSQPDYWGRVPNVDGSTNANLDTTNPAFAGYKAVPGATNGARFTYHIDQRVQSSGQVIVTSTGVVGGVTRTIRSVLTRKTFLDYAYAADKGTLDPDLYTTWPPNLFDGDDINDRDSETNHADFEYGPAAAVTARLKCSYYRYDTTRAFDPTDRWGSRRYPYAGRHADCHEFQFNGATFDGPFHFNDVIVLRGTSSRWLRQPTTTSFSNGANPPQVPDPPYRLLTSGGGTPTPTFPYPGTNAPQYATRIEFPPSNREIGDTAALGGYVFTGPTRIVLLNNGATGTIYVDSPASGTRHGLSGGRGTLAMPGNGVIYVEDAPSASCPAGYRPPLGPSTVPGVQNYWPAMYPTYPTASADDDITAYGCTAGDAYVEGELLGQLTIAAQHDIIVTWHTGYDSSPAGATPSGYSGQPPSTDRDVLGLVADGQIRALKPTKCRYRFIYNGQTTSVCFHGHNIPFHTVSGTPRTINDLMIYGALLTTQHALNVDNATMGGRIGTLTVVGSMTERFASYAGTPVAVGDQGGGHQVPRGATGVASDCNDPAAPSSLVVRSGSVCSTVGGLFKRFVYDPRLKYLEPPSFLAPDAVSWGVSSFEERAAPSGLPAP